MNNIVSIIVPVYNTNTTLIRKCVYSLINQSYNLLEIILVDDGSTNDSGKYCDVLANEDKRVLVLHKVNGGLSSARNAGLEIAKGDFISFVDSDDYLHVDSICNMMKCYNECNCDIVCMQSRVIDENGMILYCFGNDTKQIKVFESNEFIHGICRKTLSESVCDKLFPKKILLNQKFEVGRLNEDFYFLSKLLLKGANVALLDFTGYNYLKHPGTITSNSINYRSLKDAIENSLELMALSKKQKSEVYIDYVYSALFQTKVLLSVLPLEKVYKNSNDIIFAQNVVRRLYPYLGRCGLKTYDVIFLKTMLVFPKFIRFFCDIIRFVFLRK